MFGDSLFFCLFSLGVGDSELYCSWVDGNCRGWFPSLVIAGLMGIVVGLVCGCCWFVAVVLVFWFPSGCCCLWLDAGLILFWAAGLICYGLVYLFPLESAVDSTAGMETAVMVFGEQNCTLLSLGLVSYQLSVLFVFD
ncbi:hypothetical protein LOK49_LG08G00715 [Camellia lanceoleosa]|uniref:Uncharacterized protein n=1 Tax=Camellia lanceoleosa TaxID=1840588 RepID=A0ACC0GPB8_9ERIC|nr:hypothetical protein LOK49_LG08G00715 [Camellia lanceoleosa]